MAIPLTAMNAAGGQNTVWVQSGTYTQTTSGAFTNSFSSGVNIYFYVTGYGSTHGDNGTCPLLTTATNSVDIFRPSGTSLFLMFTNMCFSNTAATRGLGMVPFTSPLYLYLNGCIMDGFSNAINGDDIGSHFIWSGIHLFNSEIKNSTLNAINNVGGPIELVNSSIHGGGSDAIANGSNHTTYNVIGSVIYGNTGYAIGASTGNSNIFILNSAFVANTSGGITFNGASSGDVVRIDNSIFYGNGTYGISSANPIGLMPINRNNAYGGNTTGARNNIPAGTNDITLTANPFVNSSTGNFALNTTTGGGAALKGAGFPGTFIGGSTTGASDIGIVQSGCTGSGGGACAFSMLRTPKAEAVQQ